MSDRPLVSVIIIFLNAEKFIREAIESVFAQTYDAWELLLVDDGSTDGSTDIARTYAAQYPGWVRYLEHEGHENRGKSASRNVGIRDATGEYLAFLDADDVWLPHKLEEQVAILNSHPEAAMVYGITQWWYSWTGKPEDSQHDFTHDLGVQPNTLLRPPTLFNLFFLRQAAAIPCPCSILVRREVVERVGGFEEHFQGVYDVYEDQTFYAKVCLNAPVFVSNRCWDKYRQHADSSCAVVEKTGQEYATRLFFLEWLAEYLANQGMKDTELWHELQKQLWSFRHPLLSRTVALVQSPTESVKVLSLLIARRILPIRLRQWLWIRFQALKRWPPVGWVWLGSLQRVTPISRVWGFDRGLPVDRYYIGQFLSGHAGDIRGRVLEIAEDIYTRQFGGDCVTRSDVLDVVEGNPKATIVADLSNADHIPSATFDCIILTQTLQLIYDVPATLKTLYRILKPGGVLLATIPGISQISRYDMDRWGYFWSFTSLSARRLLEEVFPATKVEIQSHGNVLAAVAFLHGLATQELRRKDLDYRDPDYEVIITIRAVKPEA